MINSCEYQQISGASKKETAVPPANLSIPEITVSTPERVNAVSCTAESEYYNVTPHVANVHTPQGCPDSDHGLLRRRHTSHLISCRRHTCAKSIVAEPPSANKEEVAKARYKLQPNNNSSVQV